MNREVMDALSGLTLLDFFSIEAPLYYAKEPPSSKIMKKKFILEDTSAYWNEEKFAEVAMAWNPEGIYVDVFVDKPFEEAFYPKFAQGDAIELFIDTRDLKTAGFATRFCHHFLFFPQAVQGILAKEITHFRTEDVHPLCDEDDLQVNAEIGKKHYALHIFIPAHCLHGFDPQTYERLGMTYRIHRYKKEPQHFSAKAEHFSLEQQPRLWASFKLIYPK